MKFILKHTYKLIVALCFLPGFLMWLFITEAPRAILIKPKINPNEVNLLVLVKPKINPNTVKPVKSTVWNKVMLNGVKSYESFHSTRYYCPAGVLTIGYGHTGKLTKKAVVTQHEAQLALEKELEETRTLVRSQVKVPLKDHQLASLTSFTYNAGIGSLRTLINGKGRLNSGDYSSIPKLMVKYNKARVSGKMTELRGLTKRRNWEVNNLWLAKK